MGNIRFDFQGCSAVITGGASGIGQAAALELATAGADGAVLDRDTAEETLEKAAGLPGRVQGYRADVSKGAEVERAAAQILEAFQNKVDILFCNAGVGQAVMKSGFASMISTPLGSYGPPGPFFRP